MKFSVVLVTYKPKLHKILFTLESIVRQKFDDFEIIISDDGSEENYFEEIKKYFEQKKFMNYVLVPHERNQGTVKNLISALEHASGTYVRDFGPGDAFYNETCLQTLYDFFEEKKCEQCFGLMQGYYNQEGKVIYGNFTHPFDIEVYRKMTENSEEKLKKRIQKNLVLYSDNVSGACLCYKRSFYLEYLKKIENYVIYEEDIYQVLAALEDKDLLLIDEYIVMYEMDAGISTRANGNFEELLSEDVERFYKMLFKRFKNHPYVKKRKQVAVFYRIRNLYVRTLLRMFVNPDSIRYLIESGIQKMLGKHKSTISKPCFLEQEEFRKVMIEENSDASS